MCFFVFRRTRNVRFHRGTRVFRFFRVVKLVAGRIIVRRIVVPIVVSIIHVSFRRTVARVRFFSQAKLLRSGTRFVNVLCRESRFHLFLSTNGISDLRLTVPGQIRDFVVRR